MCNNKADWSVIYIVRARLVYGDNEKCNLLRLMYFIIYVKQTTVTNKFGQSAKQFKFYMCVSPCLSDNYRKSDERTGT